MTLNEEILEIVWLQAEKLDVVVLTEEKQSLSLNVVCFVDIY